MVSFELIRSENSFPYAHTPFPSHGTTLPTYGDIDLLLRQWYNPIPAQQKLILTNHSISTTTTPPTSFLLAHSQHSQHVIHHYH